MTWQHVIADLLAREIGLDVASVGPAAIERAVRNRAAALGLDSPNDYLAVLSQTSTEMNALIEEVVVPESWFFRDGQPFIRLQAHARGQTAYRILSLPCAGGEEAYSIAIALREIGLPPESFHIDARDISSRALARARDGVYGPLAFRGPDFCERSRYFRPHPAGWEVRPEIRGLVRFDAANLLDGDLLANQRPYDVIFCRNLLIYLTPEGRRQAVDSLDRLLAADGLLFVGHAEALSILEPRFRPDADRGSFAYQRAQSKVQSPKSKVQSQTPRSVYRKPQNAHIEPVAVPAPHALASGEPEFDLLDQAAELSNRQEHDQAIRLCHQALHLHGPEPRAFLLLGMIELARGQAEQAESNLLKAVYLDGEHDEALLALALISERRGDSEAASRYHKRAERARRAKGIS